MANKKNKAIEINEDAKPASAEFKTEKKTPTRIIGAVTSLAPLDSQDPTGQDVNWSALINMPEDFKIRMLIEIMSNMEIKVNPERASRDLQGYLV
tara:strand:+ start:2008 stop:2292 length:285 start_codon:yes stop_codon:yes gene_type:complete